MAAKPTSRQLNYLRALANRTGQTFTYPRTRREASREIERLKRRSPARASSASSSARTSPTQSLAAKRTPRASSQAKSPATDPTVGGRIRCEPVPVAASGNAGSDGLAGCARGGDGIGRNVRDDREPPVVDSHWLRSTRG